MNIKTTPAHRIGESLVRVVDKNGNPVKEKELVLNQKSHQFLFGSGAFDFLEYEGKRGDPDRLKKWLALFDYGTLPFYWGTYEPEEGHPLFDSRMEAAKILRENNITI